ncbi:MAG: ribosomal protein S18-alanine N-acetyltransferase [Psychrobacter sp.]|nr:ribosomal protein S18-alanine N-acetyltransferase [Psychrobacter sp.]
MDSNIQIKHCLKDDLLVGQDIDLIKAVAAIESQVQPLDAWDSQSINQLLSQDINQLLVAMMGEVIMGYCLYQQLFEQGEILRIGTHPSYRRQGIASRLLKVLFDRLKVEDVERLLLEVRADNAPAIALYERHSFEIIHRRKGYYQAANQPAMDALIMAYDVQR